MLEPLVMFEVIVMIEPPGIYAMLHLVVYMCCFISLCCLAYMYTYAMSTSIYDVWFPLVDDEPMLMPLLIPYGFL